MLDNEKIASVTLIIIYGILMTTLFPVVFAQQRAVEESEARNKLTTWAIILSSFKIIVCMTLAHLYMKLDMPIVGTEFIVIASLHAWIVWKLLHDDNWFNNQYQRLKDSFQKLKKKTKELSRVLSPLPSPV